MNNEILEALIELGLTPIDWVDACQFEKLTGIEEQKLTHRRKKWPEDLVWAKQDGNIYYSIRGYNQWLTDQAKNRYQQASASVKDQSKSTSCANANGTKSRSRTRPLRKVLAQPLKLEVT